ncbi:hypothetical protein F4820DRAFT_354282 [Hypoxylon rubiginosum]|uniref:Uncharacterized protein n=1 Tax=Hypoxylon rubiginosum TaxID=110542 RepID=A0ACB9YY76_9PEZI|nr:hypothetical protein F4820DRAFT_354282 [Hypoxylon rubiginosum]
MVTTRSASKKAASAQRPNTKTASAYPQRSSLRRALQSSRRDTAAASTDAAAPTLPPPALRRPTHIAHTNGTPAPRRGWYRVRAIVAEASGRDGRRKYLVDWEGRDPRSGGPWPNTWVDAKNVTRSAKREWEDKKAEETQGASTKA